MGLVASASAFAPPSINSRISALSMSDIAVDSSDVVIVAEPEEPKKPQYPTLNGWTADPEAFCAGLPGAVAPLGNFDPLGFTKDLPVQEIKRFREAEVTHGRVAMLATLGYLVAEPFHPFFNGVVTGPANTHLGQVQEVAPFFFAFLASLIAIAEFGRSLYGWESPLEAFRKNQELAEEEDFKGKTWLT